MKLEIGRSYKIVIGVNNNVLTFICKVVDADDDFVTFIDKFNKKYTYNKNNIISYEERGDAK